MPHGSPPEAVANTSSFSILEDELERLLNRYTRDITAIDRLGKIDPVTGRDEEIDLMTLILLQRQRKNVLLIGGPGVGKTAVFNGLAQCINSGKAPKPLQNARVIELEMSMVSAGSSSRSDMEGRLIPIVRGVAERNSTRSRPPVIFCIDEIHQLMLGFKSSGFSGVIDIMKPYLTVGDLYVVGATTLEEYEDYVKADPAIDRRFQKITLKTPDVTMTLKILLNIKANFEKHYQLKIPRECCLHIVKMTERFLRARNNPDKSILILDLACAIAVKSGEATELTDEIVNRAIAAEAGVDPNAVQ